MLLLAMISLYMLTFRLMVTMVADFCSLVILIYNTLQAEITTCKVCPPGIVYCIIFMQPQQHHQQHHHAILMNLHVILILTLSYSAYALCKSALTSHKSAVGTITKTESPFCSQ